MKRKSCAAIVLAAGQGKRMGGQVHKQFLELEGHPIVYYSIRAFQESPLIDQILLVTGETEIDYVQSEIVEKYHFDKVCAVVAGGFKALEKSLREEEKDGFVFIHDGVRPFVNEEILRRAFDAVEAYHACVVGMPSKDTVKIADADGFVSETPARSRVWNVQTPQVFDFRLAYKAYAALEQSGRSDVTDDAMIVEAFTDTKVKLVEGSYENIKLTTPEDLKIAATFLHNRK